MSEQLAEKVLNVAGIEYHNLNGGGKQWFAKDNEGHWMQIFRGEGSAFIYMKRRTYKDDLQMLPGFEKSKFFTPYCINLETFRIEYSPDLPPKATWGGSREGAGRPSTGRKRQNFYVTDEENEKLRAYLEELRK
jgi:hypothetical protein